MALAIGLPLATAGVAAAQSGPSAPEEPSGPSAPSGPDDGGTVTPPQNTPVGPSTAGRGGTGGLARTGSDAALPLAASAAALTVVLAGRRMASRFTA